MARANDLAPHLRILLGKDMIKATRAARSYSAAKSPALLSRFSGHFETAISTLSPEDSRPVLISAEDLSGCMPGLSGVLTYDAAPMLMLAASAALHAHFGPEAEITLWFTTRNAELWLKSLYWQNLRARRLVDEFETFRPKFAPAADLERIIANAHEMLGSEVRVSATALESSAQHRLGPLGAALDLLEIPSATLAPLRAQNLQPANAAEELLALNRSALDDASLKAAKREVLRKYRRSGQP